MTIVIHFHQTGYRDFKHYYQKHVYKHLFAEFPRLVSYGRFVYAQGATDVNTPLTELCSANSGVCQDFAHGMLALCRAAGISARYVSGYIHSSPRGDETLIGVEASHAWVEVFLPGNGWVGFEPTNGCPVTEAHVKIGYGRDYDDLPPVRGLRRGGARGHRPGS